MQNASEHFFKIFCEFWILLYKFPWDMSRGFGWKSSFLFRNSFLYSKTRANRNILTITYLLFGTVKTR